MTSVKLALLIATTLGTGCLFKGKMSAGTQGSSSSSGPVAQTKKECKGELSPIDSLVVPCIIDGRGNSERVGEVIPFRCRAFDLGKYTSSVSGSDPFPINTPVCKAAVYAGKIDPATGGEIKVEILAKMTEFPEGEKRNGVKSVKWSNSAGTHGYRFAN